MKEKHNLYAENSSQEKDTEEWKVSLCWL